jgi:uncharacterized protein (TIGR00299 family) protein
VKVAWFDGSSGASGDMLLGALVAAGVPLEVLQQGVDPLGLGIEFVETKVERAHLGATKVDVVVPEPRTVRHLPEIVAMFGVLDESVAEAATRVFTRLATAEAAVHQMPIDQVHFHEVGALDCIADIVGAVCGLRHLGVGRVSCSTLALGNGRAKSEHGSLPVPVPAVLELLKDGPVSEAGDAPFETTTPTGAAVLAEFVHEWASMPAMQISSIGMGAGSKDLPDRANALRLVVGELASGDGSISPVVQFEANIDDLDPRVVPVAIDQVISAGAHDAWVTPITMKKGRPALVFSAMCSPSDADAVRDAIFEHTTTIGIRQSTASKYALARTQATVSVDGHPIRVKVATHDGRTSNVSVEWDDVAAAAVALGRPAKTVLAEATGLAHRLD